MKVLTFILGLFTLSTALRIECDYIEKKYFRYGLLKTCMAKCEFDGKETIEFTRRRSSKRRSENVDDVLGVYFYSDDCMELNFIPTNIHELFPNFIALNFDETSISHLRGNELNKYKNLVWFTLEYQIDKLRHVPGQLFSQNKELQYMDFSHNGIRTIGHDIFKGLDKLTMIAFLENECISAADSIEGHLDDLKFLVLISC